MWKSFSETIKEIICENWKKICGYVIAFICGFIIATACLFFNCNRRIYAADSEIAALRTDLQRASGQVRRAGETLERVRDIQSELTTGLRESNRELHSIIEELQIIRDKVRDIEMVLDNYYSYCNINNDIHNNQTLGEK